MTSRRRGSTADHFLAEAGDLETEETSEGLDVRFKLRVLADLLVCRLCNGLFRDAATIRECLHTFCRSCFLAFVAHGGTICPTCQEPLQSNIVEAIQSDVTVQNLVDKIFPEFAVEERKQKSRLFALCGFAGEQWSDDPIAERPLRSKMVTNCSRRPVQGSGWDATYEVYSSLRSPPSENFTSDMINICITLLPANPKFPLLPRPFLATSSKMLVQHLLRYLAGRLSMAEDEANQLELVLDSHVLPRNHSLEFVCRSRRLDYQSKPVCLLYQVNGRYTPLTTVEKQKTGCGQFPLFSEKDFSSASPPPESLCFSSPHLSSFHVPDTQCGSLSLSNHAPITDNSVVE